MKKLRAILDSGQAVVEYALLLALVALALLLMFVGVEGGFHGAWTDLNTTLSSRHHKAPAGCGYAGCLPER